MTARVDKVRILPARFAATVVVLAFVVVSAALAYMNVLMWLVGVWNRSPDMSHGFLVIPTALVLLWWRRDMMKSTASRSDFRSFAVGVVVLLLGVVLQAVGVFYRANVVEAWSLVPYLFGLAICIGGWPAAKWVWPAVLFLTFMVPLPGAVNGLLGAKLQSMATAASTYSLQVLGVPAVAQGNVIWLSHGSIGVAEACNGLRMLLSFAAICFAGCVILDRSLWQKMVVLLSIPVIGIAANVMRITLTGVAYEYFDPELAGSLYHDLAGWLMMPVALGLLAVEAFLLSKVFIAQDSLGNLSAHVDAMEASVKIVATGDRVASSEAKGSRV